MPQIATLNAIANYFNYKTWQDYKADKIKNGPGKEPAKKVKHKFSLKYLSIPGVVIIVAGIYFFGTTKRTVRNAESATFSFRKNTSNDIPNSVVFSYNIDEVQADSFFIQQSWDVNRRVRIYKKAGKKEVVFAEFRKGDFFGEMALVTDEHCRANAAVTRQSRISSIDKKTAELLLNTNPGFTLEIVTEVIKRLQRTDKFLIQAFDMVMTIDEKIIHSTKLENI